MAQGLVAVGPRGLDALHFRGAIPVRGRHHRAGVGSEPDQRRLAAEALAAELADVQFAALGAHVGEAGIADVRVVRPDHRLRRRPAQRQDMVEGLEHVPVAQVPRTRGCRNT